MTVRSLVEDYFNRIAEAGSKNRADDVSSLMKQFQNSLEELTKAEDEISAELVRLTDEPCRSDAYLWIIAAQLRPSPMYLEALCKILEYPESCAWHEGIVDILYDLADERAVPYLKKALDFDFPSDPGRNLGIKILETLDKIGTSEAIGIIEECRTSTSPEIRETAEYLLE